MHPKKLLAIAILSLSNPAFGLEIAKDQWVEFMSTAVPTTFCASSQYFRQCFDVTAQLCEEVATSATRICLKKHEDQIPNSLIIVILDVATHMKPINVVREVRKIAKPDL